ncbi:mitochondrial carrier domain-containing protein [Cokeromyces recurvatus]|uniref:mitochondrial carrier domain-containing protein n=1 Tax=Cokeromyces recurvatus TaxID=90255 RepID=UPI002220B45B|nr:mitochondrial carrier domain-containing protein [Cokeromyces recurvatus]KAI7907822.1 mitochondrial carrier domain-containing protein [Cokeromyces recurvatus]
MAESVNDFIAGWIGGAAGIIVGSPLDVLKARLQAPTTPKGALMSSDRPSSWQTFKTMIQTEGLGSMFKGVLSPIVGLAGLNALLFVSYGSILRFFQHQYPSQDPSLFQVYLSGAGAGIACFFFSTPTELIKIQAQMTKAPKSTMQVTQEIFAANGLKGFYQGGLITLIRDAPSYGVYFWVYEGMKRILKVNTSGVDNDAWKLLLAGGLAGTVSWTSIYPIDVIKSRLQMQQTQHNENTRILPDRPYASIKDCVIRSYKLEGPHVFFRGLGATILRGFPVNAVTFYIYELTIDLLQ